MKINLDLINKCKKKERRAQNELYLLLLPYLRAVAQRYIYNQAEIKDVLQESFALIFKNINQYDSLKGQFHSWAVTITINTSINYFKRVIVHNEVEFLVGQHDAVVEPEVYKNMSDEELFELLKGMPQSYFVVFNLFVIDCYNHEEISNLLEISIALSRKRLSRARHWLKNAFLEKESKKINHPYKKVL